MTARAGDANPSASISDPVAAKAEWRRRIRATRQARDPALRARDAELLTATALRLAGRVDGPICAYLPVGAEPWSPTGVEALRAAGHEVLLPVVVDRDRPLDWAWYTGPDGLAPASFGLREPTGPRLGPDAVGRARLMLLPALAVDRRGVRLGQGGGYYDRTLPQVGLDVVRVALLGDDGELVDELPAAAHDCRVSAVLLPGRDVTMLGGTE